MSAVMAILCGAAGGAAALALDKLFRVRKERRMKREFFNALDAGKPIGYAPLEDDHEPLR